MPAPSPTAATGGRRRVAHPRLMSTHCNHSCSSSLDKHSWLDPEGERRSEGRRARVIGRGPAEGAAAPRAGLQRTSASRIDPGCNRSRPRSCIEQASFTTSSHWRQCRQSLRGVPEPTHSVPGGAAEECSPRAVHPASKSCNHLTCRWYCTFQSRHVRKYKPAPAHPQAHATGRLIRASCSSGCRKGGGLGDAGALPPPPPPPLLPTASMPAPAAAGAAPVPITALAARGWRGTAMTYLRGVDGGAGVSKREGWLLAGRLGVGSRAAEQGAVSAQAGRRSRLLCVPAAVPRRLGSDHKPQAAEERVAGVHRRREGRRDQADVAPAGADGRGGGVRSTGQLPGCTQAARTASQHCTLPAQPLLYSPVALRQQTVCARVARVERRLLRRRAGAREGPGQVAMHESRRAPSVHSSGRQRRQLAPPPASGAPSSPWSACPAALRAAAGEGRAGQRAAAVSHPPPLPPPMRPVRAVDLRIAELGAGAVRADYQLPPRGAGLTREVGADEHADDAVRRRPVHDGARDDLGHVERVVAAAGAKAGRGRAGQGLQGLQGLHWKRWLKTWRGRGCTGSVG